MTEQPGFDNLPPDIVRGLLSPRISRRAALKAGGIGAVTMALAACGVSGGGKKGPTGTAATKAADSYWSTKKKTGSFSFANWPLYIDVNPNNKNDHPSIDLFTKTTGIKVNYSEPIQDDDSYFGKIQPVLASGQGIGEDVIIITNGIYLDKMIELGYLIPLDHKRMPNFDKYASPLVKNPSFDPGNTYTMAWQSGMTGIGYDPKLTGREITSWQDLMDPKFKGKIGMFADIEDLPNSALLAVGAKPETSTEQDWRKAGEWLTKQRPLVRKYYQQDYIDPLSKGDIWISLAWSGDIFQANASGASLKFVIPKEGALIWTDNMCIPKYSQHPVDAMTWMDFVYQPNVAAMLTESINYVTPVPDCKAVIEADAAKAKGADKATLQGIATSPLVFPSPADYTKLHRYRVLTAAEETVWDSIFEPVYQS